MNNMIDYIFVDYLDYIIPYSFYVSIPVLVACVIYLAIYGDNKVVLRFFFVSILTFLLAIIFPNFRAMGEGPHYNCKAKFELEANNVAAAIADYFAIPTHTQIPNYSDLINSRGTLLGNMDLKRREKLIKESEFSVTIMGDVRDIVIVLASKEGKCPFYRWKCPYSKGKIYVKRMGNRGRWLESWEEI